MAITEATYFGFTRVREMSPEAQDWASVDLNWEILSKILHKTINHTHTGTSGITFPGYDAGDPTNPDLPALSEQASGGILTPGNSVAVRLSYVDQNGLETDASPETILDFSAATPRPLTPQLVSIQTAASALAGGNYVYVLTKVKGAGETVASDVLPVTVNYDQTYSVTLSFDSINHHNNPASSESGTNEGVTAINIYRSAGLDSTFQLVGVITTGSQTQFTDTNIIDPANSVRQPPNVSTFDATKKARINWGAFTHPTDASFLRVYVTRTPRLWGTQHLLSEVDLSGTPPTYIDYTGAETLSAGWPRNVTQIVAGSPKIVLSTEAEGGLLASDESDFQGFESINFKLGPSPTVTKTDGMVWYDPTADTFQGRANGTDITIGTVTGAYTHPAESSGGHIAANIPFKAGSSVSAKTIFDRIADTNGGIKQVQNVQRQIPGATTTVSTSSTTPVLVTDMQISLSPDFDGQWIEVIFSSMFSATGAVEATYLMSVNDVNDDNTVRTVSLVNGKAPVYLNHHLQLADDALTYTIKILWYVNAGTVENISGRRSLVVKKVF